MLASYCYDSKFLKIYILYVMSVSVYTLRNSKNLFFGRFQCFSFHDKGQLDLPGHRVGAYIASLL